jgi:alkyl sulfatase BDS1-like metallo-beta-lactamase superfamily hydrolase
MIVGNDGVIIIDPVECVEKCRKIDEAFRKITDLPVKAVIYTHMHPDHIFGVRAFVTEEQVREGRCRIIAHETMLENLIAATAAGSGNVLYTRNLYSFGNLLDEGPEGRVNCGIGPDALVREVSLIPPTLTVRDALDLDIAGINMHIFWIPSECDDEIAVWFPETRVLCTAEAIQGETFPNLHTLRGTRYRDPRQWYKSIDVLRSFDAEVMAPSHGRPVHGREKVAEVLTAYRDAIQFVHNQTIRYMNEGYTADELAGMIKLPNHLAEHPWLGEFYGTVKHSVREIYQGELGWFNGDPTTLDPIPPLESASRHVDLMGGRDKVVAEAQKSLDADDCQWAAELATYVIRIDREDREAREIKAKALRRLGYRTFNINWRNWYLTSALELEGLLSDRFPAVDRAGVVRAIPPSVKVEAMGLRLAAERALDVHMTMGFRFPDTGEAHALEIRRGVAEFHSEPPDQVNVSISMDNGYFSDILLGTGSFEAGIKSGRIRVDGDLNDLITFLTCFERPGAAEGIRLTLR